jgi:hypothetical protein
VSTASTFVFHKSRISQEIIIIVIELLLLLLEGLYQHGNQPSDSIKDAEFLGPMSD